MLGVFGFTSSFAVAVVALVAWGLCFAATTPIKQAYLNGLIPSSERATVLSSDNLISSAGGVVFQPSLAKVADVAGYATTEEFITHVLEKEMLHFEDAGSDDDIRNKLKGLGYIS